MRVTTAARTCARHPASEVDRTLGLRTPPASGSVTSGARYWATLDGLPGRTSPTPGIVAGADTRGLQRSTSARSRTAPRTGSSATPSASRRTSEPAVTALRMACRRSSCAAAPLAPSSLREPIWGWAVTGSPRPQRAGADRVARCCDATPRVTSDAALLHPAPSVESNSLRIAFRMPIAFMYLSVDAWTRLHPERP